MTWRRGVLDNDCIEIYDTLEWQMPFSHELKIGDTGNSCKQPLLIVCHSATSSSQANIDDLGILHWHPKGACCFSVMTGLWICNCLTYSFISSSSRVAFAGIYDRSYYCTPSARTWDEIAEARPAVSRFPWKSTGMYDDEWHSLRLLDIPTSHEGEAWFSCNSGPSLRYYGRWSICFISWNIS